MGDGGSMATVRVLEYIGFDMYSYVFTCIRSMQVDS